MAASRHNKPAPSRTARRRRSGTVEGAGVTSSFYPLCREEPEELDEPPDREEPDEPPEREVPDEDEWDEEPDEERAEEDPEGPLEPGEWEPPEGGE